MESRSDGRQSPRPSGRGNSAEISAESPARDDRNSSQVYVSSLRGLSLDFTDFPRAYAQYRSMERRKSLNNTRPTRKRGNPNRKHISFPRLRFGLMLKYPIERYWAYARGYSLLPLRGFKVRSFKQRTGGHTLIMSQSSHSVARIRMRHGQSAARLFLPAVFSVGDFNSEF